MSATDVGTRPESAAREAAPTPRRSWTSRFSAGHVVMVVAAVLAAVANYSVLASRDDRVIALAATHDIARGTTITPDLFEQVPVGLTGQALQSLLQPDELDGLLGEVAAVAIPAGALVREHDLIAPSALDDGLRRMSLPVAREQAVAGAIRPGDRIDVLHVMDGVPIFLAAGLDVLAVSEEGSGALTAGMGFSVTVAVDPETALCLAAALDAGQVHMLLATGQDPVAAPGCLATR